MKRSLRKQLLTTVLSVVSIALLLFTVGVSLYFYHTLREKAVQDEVQRMNQVAGRLEAMQQDAINLAKQIVASAEVQRAVKLAGSLGAFEEAVNQRNMRILLKRNILLKENIYDVQIFAESGAVFTSNESQGPLVSQEAWYREFLETGRAQGFTGQHMHYLQNGQAVPTISYVMRFYDLNDSTWALGNIVVSLGQGEIAAIAEMESEPLSGSALLDRDGVRICGSDHWAPPGGGVMAGVQVQTASGTLLAAGGMADGWLLLAEVSGKWLNRQMLRIVLVSLGVYLLVAAMLWLILSRYIRRISRPIEELSRAALQLGQGTFDVRTSIDTQDELSVLGDAFNHMAMNVKQLLEESVEYERINKDLEIERLMLQIDPHYIYNTLNSIVYMAQQDGNQDIVIFTNTFISLLRNSLHAGSERTFVPLRQELDNLKKYLLLQSYRYPDKFSVDWRVDEGLLDARIPSALMQPLAENAIFHGIAPAGCAARLLIGAEAERDELRLTIEDDGVGMDAQHLDALFSEQLARSGGGIGLPNVRKRLAHLYGERALFQVHSVPGEGTRATIHLPLERFSHEEQREEESL